MAQQFAALLTDSDLKFTPRNPEFLQLASSELANFATNGDGFDSVLNSLLASLPPADIVSTTLDKALADLAGPAAGIASDNEADAAQTLADTLAAGESASKDTAQVGNTPLPPTWLVNQGIKQAAQTQARTFAAAQISPNGEFVAGRSVSQVLDEISNLFK